MACQVTVSQGTMEGKICTTHSGKKYFSFEGIPYAKPPVGQLRFKDPQKPNNWSGILDATKPGNKCVQINGAGVIEGSEDCLYLNVYTPSLPHEKILKLPVLFFIHGGAFIVGCGDYYRPDYLINHDVVVVTINYRLSIFGFLCLHTREVPGNAGPKDTVMALRWVINNIGKFNGDPSNIIAYGESAGAAIAESFMMSKMTRGCVSKVICQSGSVLSDLFLLVEDEVEKAKEIASNMGKDISEPDKLLDFFSKATAEELMYAYLSSEMNRPIHIINAFLIPVVERKFENVERFFDEYPIQSIRNGNYDKLPILITMATHEGAMFLRKTDTGDIKFDPHLRNYIPRYSFINPDSERGLEIEKRFKDMYFKNKEIGKKTLSKYIDFMSDAFFARDIIYCTEMLSKYQDNVYFCRFSYPGNMNTRIMKQLGVEGTTHGDLIQYLFYKDKKAKLCKETDLKVIQMLTEAWCNFAKTGRPTWENQEVEWLPYTTNQRSCLNVGKNYMENIPLPEYERIKVWLDLIGERSKL